MTDDLRRALGELADGAPTGLTRPVHTPWRYRAPLTVGGTVLACLAVLGVVLLAPGDGDGEALRQRVDVAALTPSSEPSAEATPSTVPSGCGLDPVGSGTADGVPREATPEAAAERLAASLGETSGVPQRGWTVLSQTMNSAVLTSGAWRITALQEQDAPAGWVGLVAGRCEPGGEDAPAPSPTTPTSPSPEAAPSPSAPSSPAVAAPGPGLRVTVTVAPERPQAGQRVRVHVRVRDTDGAQSGGTVDFGNGSGAGLPVASSACTPYEGPYVVQPSDQGFDVDTTYDAAGSYTVTATVSTGGGCQDTPRESRTATARVVVGEAPSGQRVVLENDTDSAVTAYCADCPREGLPLAPSAEASFVLVESGQVEFQRADGTSTCVLFGSNEASSAAERRVRVSAAGSCPGGKASPQP